MHPLSYRVMELESRVGHLERQVAKLAPSNQSNPSTEPSRTPSDSDRLDWILRVLHIGGWNRLMLLVRWGLMEKPTREDIDRAIRSVTEQSGL